MTPEAKAKRKIVTWLDVHMPGHVRVSPRGGPFGQTGTSDYIICWHGIFIAIEVKSDVGDPTAMQMAFLKRISNAGGVAAIVRGFDQPRLEAIKNAALRKVINGI